MTQSQVADFLNVSHTLVCRWEHCSPGYQPNETHLKGICKLFRISRKELDKRAEEISNQL